MTGKVNVPIMLASLGLSVFLWFVVYSQNRPEPREVQAELHVTNLDDNRFFFDPTDTKFTLHVKGSTDDVAKIENSKPQVFVDLSNAKPGESVYPIQITPRSVTQYLDNQKLEIRLKVEALKQKTFTIETDGKGQLKDPAVTLLEKKINPKTVKVIGPASEVDKVETVKAYLDLAEIDLLNAQPQAVALIPIDANGVQPQHVRTTPAQAVISPVVSSALTDKTVVISPEFLGQPAFGFTPDGYKVEPPTVQLTGKSLSLATVSKITADPIDVTDLKTSRTYILKLHVPPGTELKSNTMVRVKYFVKPEATKKRPVNGSRGFPDRVPPLNDRRKAGEL